MGFLCAKQCSECFLCLVQLIIKKQYEEYSLYFTHIEPKAKRLNALTKVTQSTIGQAWLLMYSTGYLSSYYCSRWWNTDGLSPRGSSVLAGETACIHLCTHKDVLTLWLLWKGSAGCKERVGWWDEVAQLGKVESAVGMLVKAPPEKKHLSQALKST